MAKKLQGQKTVRKVFRLGQPEWRKKEPSQANWVWVRKTTAPKNWQRSGTLWVLSARRSRSLKVTSQLSNWDLPSMLQLGSKMFYCVKTASKGWFVTIKSISMAKITLAINRRRYWNSNITLTSCPNNKEAKAIWVFLGWEFCQLQIRAPCLFWEGKLSFLGARYKILQKIWNATLFPSKRCLLNP